MTHGPSVDCIVAVDRPRKRPVPITAKFSRDFYDRFGHEAVDELVDFLNRIDSGYRAELRELNDLNFGRFDDRLERRIAQLEAGIDERFTALDAKIDQRTAKLQADIKASLAVMESRLVKWMFLFVATGVLAVLGLG